MSLDDEFEAASDLFLADGGDGDDLFEGTGHALLTARDVQASAGDGVVRPPLQAFALVHLLEQEIRPETPDIKTLEY